MSEIIKLIQSIRDNCDSCLEFIDEDDDISYVSLIADRIVSQANDLKLKLKEK